MLSEPHQLADALGKSASLGSHQPRFVLLPSINEDLRPKLLLSGFNDRQIIDTLEQYADLNVFAISPDKTTLTIVSTAAQD